MKSPPPLEAFSFTLSGTDAEGVYDLISRAGFEKNSAGLKDYLLAAAKPKPRPAMEPGVDAQTVNLDELSDEEDMPLGEGMRKIIEAVRRNPDAMEFAKKKGARVTRSFLKHLFG